MRSLWKAYPAALASAVAMAKIPAIVHDNGSYVLVQEAAEEVALAEDANRRVEEENEALRQQLLRVQEQLQAIQTQPSPGASPQVALASPAQSLGHPSTASAALE